MGRVVAASLMIEPKHKVQHRDHRGYWVKHEALKMMREGWVLKSGPMGAWLEHDDDKWNMNHVHGNSFNAMIDGKNIKVKSGLGVMYVWELS